jgi:hypothetical protein
MATTTAATISKRGRPRDLSWTPRKRPGGVYCSSACGCGCLRADYVRAVDAGEAAARAAGQGWRYHVWENGGWHVSIKYSGFGVEAEVHLPGKNDGRQHWASIMVGQKQFEGYGSSVRTALAVAMAPAQVIAKFAAVMIPNRGK